MSISLKSLQVSLDRYLQFKWEREKIFDFYWKCIEARNYDPMRYRFDIKETDKVKELDFYLVKNFTLLSFKNEGKSIWPLI